MMFQIYKIKTNFLKVTKYQLIKSYIMNFYYISNKYHSIQLDFFIKFSKMGVYLSQPETKKNVKIDSGNKIRYCCVQMQGWRKNMQDAAIHQTSIAGGNSLFGVFDGHGGPEVSQFVKQFFTNTLTNLQQYKNGDYKSAFEKTFKLVDEKLLSIEGKTQLKNIRKSLGNNQTAEDENIAFSSGCTANVVLLTPNKIYVANSGDSRSVLCRDGKAIALSLDHKPQDPKQQQRITKAGGVVQMGRVNGGLNLTRSFGDFNYKTNANLGYKQQMITCDPDIKQFDRHKDDQFIILGCDGIWERYVDNNQGMIDRLKPQIDSKRSHQDIMKKLLDDLLAKDTMEGIGCDNMSAILIQFN